MDNIELSEKGKVFVEIGKVDFHKGCSLLAEHYNIDVKKATDYMILLLENEGIVPKPVASFFTFLKVVAVCALILLLILFVRAC